MLWFFFTLAHRIIWTTITCTYLTYVGYLRRSGKTHLECCQEMGLIQSTSSQFRGGVIQSIGSAGYVKWKQYLSDAEGTPHVVPALTEAAAAEKAAADALRAEIDSKCRIHLISR